MAIADFYWLRFIQYIGDPASAREGLPDAFALADLVTDLDPLYGYAYQSAGIVLNTFGRIGESDAILHKGITNVPARWQLAFLAAFNAWYERGDTQTGLVFLARAAASPGAPRYIERLMARLASSSDQLDLAEAHFHKLLEGTPDPEHRQRIYARLDEIRMHRDLRALNDAVRAFRLARAQFPQTLDELVGPILAVLPTAPNGASYSYDSLTGEVRLPDGSR